MNPAKKAKLEGDLQKEVDGLVRTFADTFEKSILSVVSDHGKNENFSVNLSCEDFGSALLQAESTFDQIKSCLEKYSKKLGPGESLRINLQAIPHHLMRVLRVQEKSPRASGVSVETFKNLVKSLDSYHKSALKMMEGFGGLVAGRDCLVPFVDELVDIIDHFLRQKKQSLELVKLVTSLWDASFHSRALLGKPLFTLLTSQAMTGDDLSLACFKLAGKMMANPVGSGLPLSHADALLQHCQDLVTGFVDEGWSLLEHDVWMAALIETIVAGSVNQVPSYMSPRLPMVIRMLAQLTAFPCAGPETLKACDCALKSVELMVHPVRPLPPMQPSTKSARKDKLNDLVHVSEELVEESKQDDLPHFIIPSINQISLDNIIPSTHFDDDVEQKNEVEIEEPKRPDFVTAPNLFQVPSKRGSEEPEENDEDLPELILD